MNTVVISLGSNSSDCQYQIDFAIRHIMSKLENVSVSSIYESEALNGVDAPYLNTVLVAESSMMLDDVTAFLKQWERLCGRTPESKLQGVIPIDLDVVVWNDIVLKKKDFSYPFFTRGYNELVASGAITSI